MNTISEILPRTQNLKKLTIKLWNQESSNQKILTGNSKIYMIDISDPNLNYSKLAIYNLRHLLANQHET